MEEKTNLTENLHIAFEIAKLEYDCEFRRFHEADNKLNMLLVFFTALVAGIIAIISVHSENLSAAHYILLGVLLTIMAFTLVVIILGLFPRALGAMDVLKMATKEESEKTSYKFMGTYINAYNACTQKVRKIVQFKMVATAIALILLAVDCVLIVLIAFI